MLTYLLKRILHGIFSVIVVVGIVMILIFTLLNREAIFANDPVISKKSGNSLELYQYQQWEKYGYLDLVEYQDYVVELYSKDDQRFFENGEKKESIKSDAISLGLTEEDDTEIAQIFAADFRKTYESKGYTVIRLVGKKIGKKPDANNMPMLLAVKDYPLFSRLAKFFGGIISIDTVRYVEDENFENRGISFTMSDPLNGGFSPAIMGNGTKHKYLLYFDNQFPFIHQNLITLNLGLSNVVYVGQDLATVMSSSSNQGSSVKSEKKTITGEVIETSMNLHTAMYSSGKLTESDQKYFGDQYFQCLETTNGMSKIGYSFVIGIIATIFAYLLGVPLGIFMARKKDKLADKIGTVYIVFIMAVPSLAYIFLFSQIGSSVFHLPTNFGLGDNISYYILPIVSLSLPSVASLMKWIRRYMIDQMNSDYVKFARSGGLSDAEIFSKHILKNAAIPIVHGIPGSILGCITGAIITESVYAVPGTGKLLTTAINKHDNGVIVGLTFFYACLSIISLILGDILMSLVDPRISFTSKGR